MNTAALISQENGINQRFNLWILERVRRKRGTPELPFTLEYRHIYVMPTMFGFWFGVLLALTAIGGLNFNNIRSIQHFRAKHISSFIYVDRSNHEYILRQFNSITYFVAAGSKDISTFLM